MRRTSAGALPMRLDSTTSPAGSRATMCERLRCRSTPTYTMTGPPSCRLAKAAATPRPKHGSGGPLLHGIRLVDPGDGWQGWWLGWLADEPLGMSGVGGGEHLGPGRLDLLGAAVVDIGGDQQPDARMM